MYLVVVSPIARGAGVFTPELSYYARAPVASGTIVSAEVHGRKLFAIVISCTAVRDAKLAIRSADYTLKKIELGNTHQLLSPAFVQTLMRAARFFATTPGELLYHFIPTSFLTENELVAHREAEKKTSTHEAYILQAPQHERYEEYKQLARTSFATRTSLIILTPTRIDCERVATSLEKSAGAYLYRFHGGMKSVAMAHALRGALDEPHPIVAVMTPGALALPRSDIGTIIIEREGAQAYKQPRRPFVDVRLFTQWYAEALGARLITADFPLRVESMHRYETNRARAWRDVPTRVAPTIATHLIDMRERTPPDIPRTRVPPGSFAIISEELRTALNEAHHSRKRAFLFAARRGMAPIVVCNDCGTRASCLSCGAPVVLHQRPRSGRDALTLVCHACGAMRSAHETCRQCTSWKMVPLGIGIQTVEKEIARLFPTVPCIIFDRDHVTTHRTALATIAQYEETPGAILIGTEMALPYLPDSIALSGIVSLDSLLSRPSWNVGERILSLVLTLCKKSNEALYVQTRKPDDEILLLSLKGNLGTFYRTELSDRKTYHYPPFSILVKITAHGSRRTVDATMQELKKRLSPFGFIALPHLSLTPKGVHLQSGILRLFPESASVTPSRSRRKKAELPSSERILWPNDDIQERLADLASCIVVEVNPEHIV